MHSESLEATEKECAEGRTAPRVSLSDIEANIIRSIFMTGGDLALIFDQHTPRSGPLDDEIQSLEVLTICVLVLRNGFTIIGKAAPADAANFDRLLGEKLAYEDAVRQVWPLMGYALREKLSAQT